MPRRHATVHFCTVQTRFCLVKNMVWTHWMQLWMPLFHDTSSYISKTPPIKDTYKERRKKLLSVSLVNFFWSDRNWLWWRGWVLGLPPGSDLLQTNSIYGFSVAIVFRDQWMNKKVKLIHQVSKPCVFEAEFTWVWEKLVSGFRTGSVTSFDPD